MWHTWVYIPYPLPKNERYNSSTGRKEIRKFFISIETRHSVKKRKVSDSKLKKNARFAKGEKLEQDLVWYEIASVRNFRQIDFRGNNAQIQFITYFLQLSNRKWILPYSSPMSGKKNQSQRIILKNNILTNIRI